MESELSITLIKLAEVTEQRDSLHELHNKNAARSKELLELCGTLRKELTKVTEQRDRLFEQQEQWRLSSVCRELVEQRDRLAAACDQYSEDEILCKLQTVTEQRDRLADLVKQFIYIIDITEESASGRLFHPTNITSCRAGDLQKIGGLVEALRRASRTTNPDQP
jgi:hypothetical protein